MKRIVLIVFVVVISLFSITGFLLTFGILDFDVFSTQKEPLESEKLRNMDIRLSVSERGSNEEQYRAIEQQLQEDQGVLVDLELQFENLHRDFQTHDFLNDNIKTDKPDFAGSFRFLDESEKTYNTIVSNVAYYLDKETIQRRTDSLGVTITFQDIYKENSEKYFSYLRGSYKSNILKQSTALRAIFEFLKTNQDKWEIYEKGIIFDNQGLVDEYRGLLKDFEDIQIVN